MPMPDWIFSGIPAFTMIFLNIIKQEWHHQQPYMDVQGVSLSTSSSMDVQGCLFRLPAVWTCRVYPSQSLCRVYVFLFTFVKWFTNARMPDFPVSGQSGTGMKKYQCRKQSRTGITGPGPQCSITGLRYQMPESASPAKLRWSATLPNGFFLFTIKTKNAAWARYDCRLFINYFCFYRVGFLKLSLLQ